VVGFIGISSPSSIFAQYYDHNYEKNYEKYMKDDYSNPSVQKISYNNIIKNLPDNNVDTTNALDLPNGNSQSGEDRTNADLKGNFVYVCQANNKVGNINNNNNNFNINNETTINNNTLFIENNNHSRI
jgi:hypothetical protein